MRTALGVVDIITEAQNVLMELIDILKRRLQLYSLGFPLEMDHLMDRILIGVHILHKADDAVRLMKFHMLRLLFPAVLKNNRQFRIQIGRLMKPALYFLLTESCLFKYFSVRQEIDRCAGLLCPPYHGQQAFLKFRSRNPSLIGILVDMSTAFDPDSQFFGQRIDHRGTHTMKAAAGLVRIIIKFSSRMKRCKDKPLRADALFVHPHGNPPPVIGNRRGTVRLQNHFYPVTKSRQMLIYRVIHDLIDQVVQTFGGYAADIHTGTPPDRLKPLQHRNIGSIIITALRHQIT